MNLVTVTEKMHVGPTLVEIVCSDKETLALFYLSASGYLSWSEPPVSVQGSISFIWNARITNDVLSLTEFIEDLEPDWIIIGKTVDSEGGQVIELIRSEYMLHVDRVALAFKRVESFLNSIE